jgi:glycosyltransferase involved in cell wall biosynthesis
VVLEGHASGLPAVVFDSGGPQETVRAFGSGIVVPNDGAKALAAGLGRMVDDHALYARLRHNALAVARQLDWERVADALWVDGEAPQPAPTMLGVA